MATCCAWLSGKEINHVAAFSAVTGKWHMEHLLQPVKGEITPAIGPGSVLYQAGNDFYAFSPQKGFGVCFASKTKSGEASISRTVIEVQQGNRLYVFGLKRESGRRVFR